MRDFSINEILEKAHSVDTFYLADRLDTDLESGLTEEEALSRIKIFGENYLKTTSNNSYISLIYRQIKNPMAILLLAAIILSFFFFSFIDTVFMAMILLINVAIGVYQEKRAGDVFASMSKQVSNKLTVIRSGKKRLLDSRFLVPGDLVLVEAGKKIPADMRVISTDSVMTDESSLSGESRPKLKKDTVLKEDTEMFDRENILYASSLLLQGFGTALVLATGKDSYYGKMAKKMDLAEEVATPIQKKTKKLTLYITGIILLIMSIVAALAFWRGYSLSDIGLISISLAVSAIPEGLPAAIITALALGMERILKKGGLVKYPAAAEALGSVDYILSDKTGTLTSGNMELTDCVSLAKIQNLNSEQDDKQVLRSAVLASDAYMERKKDKGFVAQGRPIERAIIEAGVKSGFSQDQMFENGYERLAFAPFSSNSRFAASLNKDKSGGVFIHISGAPEALIEKSKYVLLNGKSVLFSDKLKKVFLEKQNEISSQGKRMTAAAICKTCSSLDDLNSGQAPITFLGFMIFEDEVRDSVKSAIKEANDLRVAVLMLTGDHPQTALSIAKKVGIADDKSRLLTGSELKDLSDKDIFKAIKNKKTSLRVFARMLPEQKMRIAKILQRNGYAVAMTGDGINDAPALYGAEIGIAVESGTDVAKAAADMILLKNSFSVISFALKEGRRILLNIYKIIIFMLSTAMGETVLLSVALLAGGPLPLLPSQLLWHNMVEGGLMNFPFAFDKNNNALSLSGKRKKDFEKNVYKFTAYTTFVFSVILLSLYLIFLKLALPIEELRSLLFITMSTSGFVLAFVLKNLYKSVFRTSLFNNKVLNLAISFNLLLLIATFTFRSLRELLQLAPVNSFDLSIIFSVMFVKLVLIEFIKKKVFASA